MECFDTMIPCEFCHIRLPNRFSTECKETWHPELDVFYVPLDETIFAVDRELSHVSVRDMLINFQLARSRIRKIHCIYANGDVFDVSHMLPCFGRLKSLNLNGLLIGRSDLRTIGNLTVLLEELVLRVTSDVICDDLMNLYNCNSLLKHVHIINHRRLGCTCLSQLPAHSMESLSLTGCNFPINFIECVTKWKKFSRLLVESCTNVPDSFIETVFLVLQKLQVFRYHFVYEDHNLSVVYPPSSANNITVLVLFNNALVNDGLLLQICSVCTNLEHLFLGILVFNTSDSPEIHGKSLPLFTLTVFSVCELSTLNKLSCLGFFGIHIGEDNDHLLHELDAVKNLEVLYLVTSNDYNLTQDACHIFKNCYKLHTLLLLGYVFLRADLLHVIKAVQEFEDECPQFTLRLLVNSTFAEMDYSPHPNLIVYPTMEKELITVIERVCA